jgi:D-glycero-alpha-D-manno-heptose-7-phosphate kinase
MPDLRKAVRIIHSAAPTRICDIGGWTDTWFARYGTVLNIAVTPVVEVELRVFAEGENSAPITIEARNYNQRYSIDRPNGSYGEHPLIEAVFDFVPLPQGLAVGVSISSQAPAGCSTGTSASLVIALIGALDCLTPGRMNRYELVAAAHKVETELLRRQCGIQDQIAAAFGGINFIEMDEYPHARVNRVELPRSVKEELESRLSLIFVGQGHSSSEVHELVIRNLEDAGSEAPQLHRLRAIAARSRDALYDGDFVAFGRTMIENTDAQRDLHPQLVGSAHQQIIDIAKEYGALGWKVNGAGGEGGSLTLLSAPGRPAQTAMREIIDLTNPRHRNIPITLHNDGLTVREDPPGE